MDHTVKSSTAFTERIRGFQLAPEDQLVSFDVTSLFTQVPINEALRVVKEQLNKDQTLSERTSIPVSQLVGLMELCLKPRTSSSKTTTSSRRTVQPWVLLSHQSLPTCLWKTWNRRPFNQRCSNPNSGFVMLTTHSSYGPKGRSICMPFMNRYQVSGIRYHQRVR